MVSFSPPLGTMSDIPPKADIGTQSCNVRFVPEMEVASGLGGAALHSPTLPDLAGRADHYLSTTTGRMRLKLSAGHEMPRCHVRVLPSDRCQVEYQFHNLILRPQARHDNLAVSRALFKAAAEKHPGRLVMLCDRARVLARSDRARPPTTSQRNRPRGGSITRNFCGCLSGYSATPSTVADQIRPRRSFSRFVRPAECSQGKSSQN